MKDVTEYLAIVVIAAVLGFWMLAQLGVEAQDILNQTAQMITGGF